MKEAKNILRLIKDILFKPRKTASGYALGNYDMKAMNYFIAFISVLFWITIMDFALFIDNTLMFVTLLILGSVLIPILIFNVKKIIVYVYLRIINNGLEHKVSFTFMEKILSPYILTGLILLTALNIVKRYIVLIEGFISIAVLLWFNLQIYLNIIYRIKTKNFINDKLNFVIKKIVILFISLSILQSGIFVLEKLEILDNLKNNGLNYKNGEIRVEVYGECKQILDEIEEMRANGKGISNERLNEIISKINHITLFKIDSSLRENELKLIKTTKYIAELNKKWYKLKLEGDEIHAKELLTEYNNSIQKAYFLNENYYKNN